MTIAAISIPTSDMNLKRVKPCFKQQVNFVDFYRVFDLEFSIVSDSEKVSGVFRALLSRFLIQKKDGIELSYQVLTKGGHSELNSTWSKIITDDRVYIVEEPGDLIGYAYMKIMDSVLSKVSSHYLFHAASLSFRDTGIIFPAVSKSGKSTLTLELLKRGFKFLSDDVAAISRSDHTLHPFPKRLGLLPHTLELCPEAKSASLKSLPMIGGGEKRLLDITNLYPNSIGRVSKLKYLVFLSPPHLRGESENDCLYVVISKTYSELMEDIRNIDGVRDVSVYSHKRHPILKLLLNGKGNILSHVEEVCFNHQVLLFDSSNGREEKPNFNNLPEIKKIPGSTASLQLLQQLKAGSKSVIMDDCKGSTARLLIALTEVLKGVECFYITPGRLKERADMICEMVRNGGEYE